MIFYKHHIMTDPNPDSPSDIQPTLVSEIVNENGSETPKLESPETLEKTEEEEQSMETKENIEITSQISNTTSIIEEQFKCPDEIKETLIKQMKEIPRMRKMKYLSLIHYTQKGLAWTTRDFINRLKG